ncbi:plastid division protein PDV1-like [Musa acuminata AAA Group]|uniref:plastid division protein PDV1-like n=1 Tax=Musa acuminata AAA Group TaxID=214697 RepID=UPI0031D596D8
MASTAPSCSPTAASSSSPEAPAMGGGDGSDGKRGFVFVKDFQAEEDGIAIAEARCLDAIRSALENLEDQLEFFHAIKSQQRAERDAAMVRLGQSRNILSRRLAEHQGKKYIVIEMA